MWVRSRIGADGPLNRRVDSAGITFLGDGARPVLPGLLDQIPDGERLGCDRRDHTATIDRQASAIIPIRKNGRWKEATRP